MGGISIQSVLNINVVIPWLDHGIQALLHCSGQRGLNLKILSSLAVAGSMLRTVKKVDFRLRGNDTECVRAKDLDPVVKPRDDDLFTLIATLVCRQVRDDVENIMNITKCIGERRNIAHNELRMTS